MHISSLILLTGTFTHSALAKVTDDYAGLDTPQGTITFCNEKNFGGPCSDAMYFKWGVCGTIPNSNAKEDKGSSFYGNGGTSLCTLFTDVNCTGKTSAEVFFMKEIKREPPYRSFKCREIPKAWST